MHKVVSAELHRLDRDIARVHRRDEDHRHLRIKRVKFAKRFETRDFGEHDIEQHDAGLLGAKHFQAVIGRRGFKHGDVGLSERSLNQVADGTVIIHNQNFCPGDIRHIARNLKRRWLARTS